MRLGIITLIITIIQTVVAFAILFTVYMIFALLDYSGGMDGFLGLTFIQPVLGIIISGATVFLCFLVGLPIRFYQPLQSAFSRAFFINFAFALTGITLLILCTIPAFQETISVIEDEYPVTRQIPNTAMFITGWFITAFFTLHTFPPRILMEKVDLIINSFLAAKSN